MFCDFCSCEQCQKGTGHLKHTQTVDGRWICNVCYRYEVCIDAVGEPCDKPCEHRPKLVNGEWTSWTWTPDDEPELLPVDDAGFQQAVKQRQIALEMDGQILGDKYVKCETEACRFFKEAVKEASTALDMNQQELADEMLISRPTLERWKRGKNLPGPNVRKSVIRWLRNKLHRLLR